MASSSDKSRIKHLRRHLNRCLQKRKDIVDQIIPFDKLRLEPLESFDFLESESSPNINSKNGEITHNINPKKIDINPDIIEFTSNTPKSVFSDDYSSVSTENLSNIDPINENENQNSISSLNALLNVCPKELLEKFAKQACQKRKS